jgi:hypothetical protein
MGPSTINREPPDMELDFGVNLSVPNNGLSLFTSVCSRQSGFRDSPPLTIQVLLLGADHLFRRGFADGLG